MLQRERRYVGIAARDRNILGKHGVAGAALQAVDDDTLTATADVPDGDGILLLVESRLLIVPEKKLSS